MLKNTEKVLKAAGDRTRLRILKMLEPGPLCVCQVVETLGVSQSVVSKHLSILVGAGLLSDERQGKWIFYSLAKPESELCRRVQAAVRCTGTDDPQVAKDLVKVASEKVQSLLRSCPSR
jgi:ArsR family transcriptional regulator